MLEHVLNEKRNIDYIIGNPVMALEAASMLTNYKDKNPNDKIISTYLLPEVYNKIKSKEIYAHIGDSLS